ncbi:N-formylglutamate amidohydrolase [Caenispirillum bisanense]|uniref:N-formylglutamate amidohydrolase n=1 Tax=Caenispirillum bisanense TaxID=414052 RepID=UPI0031DBF2CE
MPDDVAMVDCRPPVASSTPAPVVFDSPHSGRHYPADFRPALPLRQLQGGEDRHVDRLIARAPEHGAWLVTAGFARTYIDPNRDIADIDPDLLDGPWPGRVDPGGHSRHGIGLVFRTLGDGTPIYDRRLSVAEVQGRIDRCWRPYHTALEQALSRAGEGWRRVWHLNCHSMLPVGDALSPDPGCRRADMVLGDRGGRSCEPAFTALVATVLRDLGYSVAINDPYQGAWIVARHGRPQEGRHSLQIEINRALYMDLTTLAPHAGFDRLQADLGDLAREVCAHARRHGA